jgi:hypothetical protein
VREKIMRAAIKPVGHLTRCDVKSGCLDTVLPCSYTRLHTCASYHTHVQVDMW